MRWLLKAPLLLGPFWLSFQRNTTPGSSITGDGVSTNTDILASYAPVDEGTSGTEAMHQQQ
ncbi:hypothetical protein AJ80_05486 [Polytolypa hystricis UAMH7299]|uniref:Uncharacterized protein n=1 Tax=Polytolypa hystricis (strain UAMH7299) TaxID=1447883 RepID=A0A2B7Y3K0_POLH7|nr:hypothetical protein AJ80_05486 [Polytolypa hystricis UAMH7299]